MPALAKDPYVPRFKRTGRSQERALTRGRLIEAAHQLLAHRSFAQFSMDSVSAATGLSRRTVYNVFLSKEELYKASRQALLHALAEQIPDEIPPRMDPADALRFFSQAAFDLFSDDRHIELVASIDRDGSDNPWLAADYARYVRLPLLRICENYLLGRAWRRELRPADARVAAEQLLALIEAIAVAPRSPGRLHPVTARTPSDQIVVAVKAYASLFAPSLM